jgi:hypothetical protein
MTVFKRETSFPGDGYALINNSALLMAIPV